MTFTPRTTAPSYDDKNWIHYSAGGYNYCIIISGNSCIPNCVGYCWGRWRELLGEYHNLSRGDAGTWYTFNDGYERGQKPKLGAVGVYEDVTGGAGHVVSVEEIYSDGSFLVSESAYDGFRFNTQVLPSSCYYSSKFRFLGFIYLPISFDEPEYEPPVPISGNRFLSLSEMKVNAEYIWWYLSNKGWSLNAVAGMLGNMQRESTINPTIWQDLDEGNTSLGYGLVQWTPATKYISWCNDRDLVYSEMDSNLKRILWELENNEQYYATDDYPESFYQFSISTKSVSYLVTAFLKNYERAGVEALDERISNGEYWYNYLKDFDFDSGGSPTPDDNHKPILFKRKKGYKFVLYARLRRERGFM